ncbi:MAG: energy-coupling factor transporter transmembrane protein EcfT [Clostridia bacterium]|nr:energy-coupling factor transporter transmembrane protein EcfT [Clostridia bacterium]
MTDEFSRFHPAVNGTYFIFIIGFSMFLMHPLCLAVSLLTGLAYSVILNGKKAVASNMRFMLPMMIITAIINPAFNHEGATILMYLSNGNPVTLESITYGVAAATMLMSVVTWFSCYNVVMTSDKFIYIFGRIIPSLSLIFSMVLRFVPRFKVQIKEIAHSQRCRGRDVSYGRIKERLQNSMMIMSVMVTWSLENSIETADSMKSRGYGLKGRTAFSIFKFDTRDLIVLINILIFSGITMICAANGILRFSYFPLMKGTKADVSSLAGFGSYFLLCAAPIVINIWEGWRWKHTQLKI